MQRGLSSLPPSLAETVGAHLAAATELMDDDPELAYRHAAAARELAPRVATTRGVSAFLAYRTERYGEALADFRTVRRLTGQDDVLPAMADCERGLRRPARALELIREARALKPPEEVEVELAIVESGARRDMGQPDAAVLALRLPALEATASDWWAPRLWYAYAEALLAAGKRAEAIEWFQRAADVDEDELTDADDRLEELLGQG